MAVCLCPSHLISVATPCLECVHASVHVYMSTQLPMLAQHPMDSYMETWLPLCDSERVSRSPCFWSDTLVRMCDMHQYMNLCLPYTPHLVHPLWIVTWKLGCPCVLLHLCPSHLIFVPTPCLDCLHASVHEFMSTWLLMSGPPPLHSLMET